MAERAETIQLICVLCAQVNVFTDEPVGWGPCRCGESHFVCLWCVGSLLGLGYSDAGEVCPADPGLRVALSLMGEEL